MYNAHKPNPDDLPTSAQLLRSTVLAAGAAAAILVAVVWPAEYGVDPTGVGGLLGLTEMGEIKTQLSEEAEADRKPNAAGDEQSNLGGAVFSFFVGAAQAQQAAWTDEIAFDLAPGEGTEIKLAMTKDAVAAYSWTVDGGVVNFDLHGDGGGQAVSYEKGRGTPAQEGELTAAFDGNHGWFWRNRGDAPVTVILRVSGDYTEVKRFD